MHLHGTWTSHGRVLDESLSSPGAWRAHVDVAKRVPVVERRLQRDVVDARLVRRVAAAVQVAGQHGDDSAAALRLQQRDRSVSDMSRECLRRVPPSACSSASASSASYSSVRAEAAGSYIGKCESTTILSLRATAARSSSRSHASCASPNPPLNGTYLYREAPRQFREGSLARRARSTAHAPQQPRVLDAGEEVDAALAYGGWHRQPSE